VFNSWGYSFADVVPANSGDTAKAQVGVIPARMAGELVPTGTTGPSNPGTGPVSCSNDGSEGSVDAVTLGSPEETTVAENENEVELIAFEVELSDDGDLCLDRFDLYMGQDNTVTASNRPWDYFTEAYLMVEGEEIASMSVDSSSDWTEFDTGTLTTTSQEYRLRFTGLNTGLQSDEVSKVSVAFDTVSNMDSADEDAVWQFGTETDSFRFTDGTGFTFTAGANLQDDFAFEAADSAVLALSLSSDSPDASVIEVSKTVDTNGVHIATYEVEETNDVDVNIDEITVGLAVFADAGAVAPAETIGAMIKKAYLVIDGDVVGTENVTGAGTTATITFDNLDIDIDGDTEVDMEVHVDLDDTNNGARYTSGAGVRASSFDVTGFEDVMGDDEGDSNPAAAGVAETHQVRTEGIMVELNSVSASSVTIDGANNDRAELTIVFDVTAFGETAFVDKRETQTSSSTGTTGTAPTTTQGVGFHIQFAGTDPLLTETTGTTLTSTAEELSDTFRVDKDDTETFTLKVIVANDGTPDLSGTNVRALLTGIGYGIANDATADAVYTFNLTDYRTGYAIIAD